MSRACYFISGSPPCWSAMLALEFKGLAYEPRRLDTAKGEQKSPAFLAVNPRGTVPVLVEGGEAHRETLAILAYLDAAYPEPPLFGAGPGETSRIWRLILEAEARLRTPIGDACRPIFRGRTEERAQEILTTLAPVRPELAALDAALAEQAWLAGPAASAADLIVYPLLMQLMRGVERAEGVLDLGLAPLTETHPELAAWADRMAALPGADRAYPPHWR